MYNIFLLASLFTQSVQRPDLGGIVLILLENPAVDFSRDTNNAILNISSHKPTSRETDFC